MKMKHDVKTAKYRNDRLDTLAEFVKSERKHGGKKRQKYESSDLEGSREEGEELAEGRFVQQILVRVFSFSWLLIGLLQ